MHRHFVRLSILLSTLITFALVAFPAAAQDCGNVSYRLWTKTSETWYRLGETVEIPSGTEGHIYLHVDSRSRHPYGTSAQVGYPRNIGIPGPKSLDVERHIQMKAQSAADKQNGRLRFDAAQPGHTTLAYRLTGVSSPGSFNLVARGCRTGSIPVRVTGGQHQGPGQGHGQGPGPGGGPGGDRNQAAQSLVQDLYVALLRRPTAGDVDRSFVRNVADHGRDGVLETAEVILASEEFRRGALQRTEERHGRNNLETLRRQLLADMYRDLYGYNEPDRDTQRDDLRDLEDCLGIDYRGENACRRLGRELVDRRAFYEQHQEQLDTITTPQDQRRRPGRPGRGGRG